ncbi:hypothetical protein HPB50_011427 [Hyalomma asiaticum]|uniref:Uncharacterized protein n=1 Tax=Hyalomma asiaticum TaxID=266040 RepID=A0ACB7SDQ6_HYAAI|nr:hypothetical protein HPB50_011427 [Hyalomma asiaticum]
MSSSFASDVDSGTRRASGKSRGPTEGAVVVPKQWWECLRGTGVLQLIPPKAMRASLAARKSFAAVTSSNEGFTEMLGTDRIGPLVAVQVPTMDTGRCRHGF